MNKLLIWLVGVIVMTMIALQGLAMPASLQSAALETVAESGYAEYAARHQMVPMNGDEILLLPQQARVLSGSASLGLTHGRQALIADDESRLNWVFQVEREGLYRLSFDYCNIQGTGSTIERAVYLDGRLPFQESYNINLPRVFRDEGGIQVNPEGDDFRPEQAEIIAWREENARDQFGYFGQALYYYLDAGEHSLDLVALREPLAIGSLRLVSQELNQPTYFEYLNGHLNRGAQPVSGVLANGLWKVQAEQPFQKSHSSLYAVNDNTSPRTEPYDPAYKKLNAIGGTRWNQSGQWITWEVEAPSDGLYLIGARSKQNVYRDMVSSRTLLIDGEVPFTEALDLVFPYTDRWQVAPFGGVDGTFLFYLTEGRHEITLSVSLGNIAQVLMESARQLEEMNKISLQLIALMGTTPDQDRDYRIDVFMPELLSWIEGVRLELRDIRDSLVVMSANVDEMIAHLDQLDFQMSRMVRDPDRISELFGRYRELVRGFGNWIMQAREKPLLLDYLFIAEQNAPLPEAEYGFLRNLWYGLQSFAASFYVDYTSLSGRLEEQQRDYITVWIGDGLSGGRDQAIALNRMIRNDFTAQTGIPVKLQLIPAGTILTATLAGNGPDVALQLDGTAPVNYAMRNALYDLSAFDDLEEVLSRFPKPAVVPFVYRDGLYAIPETFSFPMMFYRSDILRELNVDISGIDTWDDVIRLLPTLQRQNMSFGLYPDLGMYLMFLYQRGGSLYSQELDRSNLDTQEAIEAFTFWMEFYTSYALERDYNFVDRFRTGEMPIGIADYTTYNLLFVSAPEIRGQWGMVPVPGTRRIDGSVLDSVPSGGAGAVIMKDTDYPEEAWAFIKWWTSAQVQYRYGMELEAVMGVGARYNTANLDAFARLPWPSADRRSLQIQQSRTVGTPQVPGGYYTARYIDFAKIAVYDKGADPKDALMEYVEEINSEIRQKRLEFGLEP